MEGQFSGHVSSIDTEDPVKLTHHIIVDNSIDPRVSVIKEYLSKVPNASLKDLKKALVGFSKASEEELKIIIKSANNDKYNELFSSTPLPNKSIKTSVNTEEVIIDKNGQIVDTTNLSSRSIAAYKANMTMRRQKSLLNVQHHNNILNSNHQPDNKLKERVIGLLYKSGYTAQSVHDVKPILLNLMKENKDCGEIELAIEFLKP
jgi:PPE-repeat protein